MHTYSLVIIDDDTKFTRILENIIKEAFPAQFEINSWTDIEAKYNLIHRRYDIYFLDIEMPKYTGFDIAKEIRKYDENGLIIFLTTHEEFSMDGYEYQAFRFISKLQLQENLNKGIVAAIAKLNETYTFVMAKNSAGITVNVYLKDVCCIYSEKNYVILNTIKDIYQVRTTLKDFVIQYSPTFFVSPQKGIIVNLKFISSIDYENDILYLEGNGTVKISRRRRKLFYEAYTKGYT